MPEDIVVRLSFPAKADYLLLARLALAGIARELPMEEELLADLKLAVTEACGNAVRHAYPDGAGAVSVCYRVSGDTLEVIVEDQGVGMSAAAGDAPRAAVPDSGMGMSIIKTIVDELVVDNGSDGRGTVLRMSKRLAARAG